MGTKRVGLARVEALIENLKRELTLGTATLSAKGFQPVAQSLTSTYLDRDWETEPLVKTLHL